MTGGRFVSWVGFVFGSVMSIAANVLHTWLPQKPEDAPPDWVPPADWTPSLAAQIGSAVWPIALLLSVEVLSRVQWPSSAIWKVARFGGVGAVGLGSAVISYGHLYDVLFAWGYGRLGAGVGPLVLDGLMVVSGFALLAHGDPAPAVKKTVADAVADTADPPPTPPKLHSVPARKTAPVVKATVGEHHDKVAEIVANKGGRGTVMKELGVTEAQARALLEKVKATQP